MKKRYGSFLLVIFFVMLLSACNKGAEGGEKGSQSVRPQSEKTMQNIKSTNENNENKWQETTLCIFDEWTGEPKEEAEGRKEETGGTKMQKLIVEIHGQRFQAVLYDNETTQALIEKLPMTIEMEELNRNEKFYYLDEELPMNSENVGSILAGDIMLFGSDCLVLFYDDFSTPYSYTRIGHIEDEEAFARALADGTVEVTLKAGESRAKPWKSQKSLLRRQDGEFIDIRK